MAKKKYYAVRIGRTPAVYDSWADCEKQVKGYPGAAFKSFESMDDALLFMSGGSKGEALLEKGSSEINEAVTERIASLSEGELVAFVDGSFDAAKKMTGYGAVLIDISGEEHTLSGSFKRSDGEDYIALRNVAGELSGAVAAVKYAMAHGYKKIYIYYDYAGIEKWAKGEWKTNRSMTTRYASWIKQQQKNIDIIFIKVPAHTGVSYNEMADKLAKKSLTGGNDNEDL